MESPLLAPIDKISKQIRFRQGTRAPFAIRWFGITSLFGHTRHFAASAIASESIDSRDWMRPERPEETLARVYELLGIDPSAKTIAEGLGRPLIVDFVADTGDDRDVGTAIAKMIFADYRVVMEGKERALPRGDILLFGGDTAYPVATAEEIEERVIAPWNEVLALAPDDGRTRVLLGIPGNHDWFDGLDGFARMFRRAFDGTEDVGADPEEDESGEEGTEGGPGHLGRKTQAFVERQLHLDEVRGALGLLSRTARSVRAFFQGKAVRRTKRLVLRGYRPVQETTYFSLPLAKGLDLLAVDRQLRHLDFRQRTFMRRLIASRPGNAMLFIAPDPALAFGEEHAVGQAMLKACHLSLARDRIFYLTGDVHHYERREEERSLHVIAGGGGAFVHGTRIAPWPERGAPKAAFPDRAASRRLALQVPWKLAVGRAGFLVHILLVIVGLLALRTGGKHHVFGTSLALTALIATILYFVAGHHRRHATKVAFLSVPFGIFLGTLPFAVADYLSHYVPRLATVSFSILAYSFLGSFAFGLFLMTLVLTGWEHQQAFSVLSHPGFKHFVRLAIHPNGLVEGWAIGKADTLSEAAPQLIDSFTWKGAVNES